MDYKELELKEKMAALVNKWKGKDISEKSADWWRRRGDRSLYVHYQVKLKKLQNKAPGKDKPQDVVALAEQIFT